jgi:uncharacterized iron-regulated protein
VPGYAGRMHRTLPIACLMLLAGCATPLPATPVLVYGEQHDQPDQQRLVADDVARLAAEGRLGAVVVEMAESGRDTRGLPVDADEARVRAALAWTGWPWPTYAAVVMNAVRAGVPVFGGNLPRVHIRDAMVDATLDGRVPASVREELAEAVRDGHCGMLAPAQEPGMVRVQIGRDLSMARTIAAALAGAAPGRQVVLLTGAQHASRDRGVPLHLPAGLEAHVVMFGESGDGLAADERRPARFTPHPDPCLGLGEKLKTP